MYQSLESPWKILWRSIPSQRKKQYVFLTFLIILSSFAEVISLGAVVPFLLVLTDPSKIFDHSSFATWKEAFSVSSATDLVLPITIFFVCASVVAGLVRIYLLKISINLSHNTGGDISKLIYKNVLYQSYLDHLEENSSKFISGIISKANQVVTYTIQPAISLISSGLILAVLFTIMVSLDPLLILGAFVTITSLYLMFAVKAKRSLLSNSKVMAQELSNLQKTLSEGFGGIRDVILDNTQDIYLKKYLSSDVPYRNALSENAFKSSSPKYYVEAFGLVLFAFFSYFLAIKHGSLTENLPTLGALALAAQRMLPLIQMSYNAWANIKAGRVILMDVCKLLNLETKIESRRNTFTKIPFHQDIEFDGVSFTYPQTNQQTLSMIKFVIRKGDRVGIVGKTGSGKSTLLDIIMGLIQPDSGSIKIDGKILKKADMIGWQKNLAHVPQTIFLSDASIAENVALGVEPSRIDRSRIENCLRSSELWDFVQSLDQGIDSVVGERGVKLSGGQRQRIGIARALYKNAEILIFDEATSALDEETERALMKSIYNLNKNLTLIIVTHRLNTIQNCDFVIVLENGLVKKMGAVSAV